LSTPQTAFQGEFIKLHESSINENYTGSLKRFLKPTISTNKEGGDKPRLLCWSKWRDSELRRASSEASRTKKAKKRKLFAA